MTDIDKIWQNSDTGEPVLNNMLNNMNFDKINSKHPLAKLRRNLLITLGLSVLITLLYAVAMFFVEAWQVILPLMLMIAFNIFVIVGGWHLFKSLPASVTPGNSLMQELERHYNAFMEWWKIQQKLSLFIYPVAAAGGFIYGGMMGSGKAVEEFLYNPYMLSIMAVTSIVLVPFSYLYAKWLFRMIYGKHLKHLKDCIDELSS